MNKNRTLLIAAVLLLIFAAVKFALFFWWQNSQPAAQQAVCDLRQGCMLPDGVYAKADRKIPTNAPFDIELRNVPAGVKEVSVSFSMKNMDMGFNRYGLADEGGGVWTARQIRLPVCTEQRRDYLADIRIGGVVFQTAFTAD
ncbi:hypothetical protein [Neisseria chenwenguii]|uniref:Uncharacterized protein n=1 Tax=Neisseria chenwenguii TaxID=1853278 RepID=A0A220S483_9NEIS|nr:hypothetical protein [Neisseria chenwenguii]ASK28015.1 hypothetical protein BG910_10005 [Neisseria chenwenguii]ROV57166.1 hypothetical protein EGS38_00265 [Neisseria chenwenguii]